MTSNLTDEDVRKGLRLETNTQLRTGRSKWLKILPRLRAIGTIGLVGGVFEIGWKLGSGINAKFLKLGVPELTVNPNAARWDRLQFRTAHSQSYYGASWPAEDGWLGEFHYNNTRYNRWWEDPCPFTGFSPPAPLVVMGPVASTAPCAYGYPSQLAPINVLYAWVGEDALRATTPIQDYGTQPYGYSTSSWPDKPSSLAAAEQRTRDMLHSGEVPKVGALYDSWLDPDDQEDPAEPAERSDESCRRSLPLLADPRPDLGTSPPRREWYEPPHTTFTRVDTGVQYPTQLRLGRVESTSGQDDGDGDGRKFEGWGYRKIKAKHGWSVADAADTQFALEREPVQQFGPSRIHHYEYSVGDRLCLRRVVVNTERTYWELQGDAQGEFPPRDIVNSYAIELH